MARAINQITSAESAITNLSSSLHNVESSLNPSLNDVPRASRFIGPVSSESFRLIRNTTNGIIFNIPDRQLLERIKQNMKSCNVGHYLIHCVELGKIVQLKSFLLLRGLQDENVTQEFTKMILLLLIPHAAYLDCGKKTPIWLEVLGPQYSVTTTPHWYRSLGVLVPLLNHRAHTHGL